VRDRRRWLSGAGADDGPDGPDARSGPSLKPGYPACRPVRFRGLFPRSVSAGRL